MSDKIKELIGNISDGANVQAREIFRDIMAEKLGETLDQERIRVSGVIYNGMTSEDFVTESKDEDYEDDDDMDDEDEDKKKKKKKKSDESDDDESADD